MRLIAILSPTNRWGTKTEYTKLRKFLHKDGYIRIAPEVFMRIVTNRKASKLQELLNFSEEEYIAAGEQAEKSLVKKACELYNKKYKTYNLMKLKK